MAGCSSNENELIESAESKINDDYGIEVDIVNIEPQTGYGSSFVYFMTLLLGSETYDLTFETVEEPKIVFEGSIQEGSDYFSENYVSAKHESLIKNDENYQDLNEVLLQNGFSDISLSSGFNENAIENILFEGKYDGVEVNVEELLKAMHQMGELIVSEVPSDISLKYRVEADEYRGEEIRRLPVEFLISNSSTKKIDSFDTILSEQINAFRSNQAMTEELLLELENLNLSPSSGLEIVDHEEDNSRQKWFEHRVKMIALEPFSEENLLIAVELLRKSGMDEAFLKVIFNDDEMESCQVKDIHVIKDFQGCFY